MIVDTSALLAIALREPEAELFGQAILGAASTLPSIVYVEAGLKRTKAGHGLAHHELDALVEQFALVVVPFTAEHARVAVGAISTYGKGRHPARLNFGDCMVYAVAKLAGMPLLFKGEDFARTDLVSALSATP